jgi:hypothetical protein
MTYQKTRQPIDLDLWPMTYDANAPYFTTIGNYRQEDEDGNDISYNSQTYHWSKHHEWEKFIDLPSRTSQRFELALNVGDSGDRGALESNGWRVISPIEMSLHVFDRYPAYIRASRAEFTVAKDQNVRLRSGWFSERDACYLASGKPVIAQDTGFGSVLPTGEGLFAFSTMDEALASIEAVNGDYRRHCQAARGVARDYFEASAVAKRLLIDIGLA